MSDSNNDHKFHMHFGDQSVSLDQKHLPYILLGVGALVLLMGNIGFWNFWPLFVLIPGLGLIYASRQCEGRNGLEQFKGGVITTATGLVLMYQSITGHWESWAYIWAIYPLLGAGFLEYYEGKLLGKDSKVREGMAQMKIWSIVLVASALVFEVFIFQNISSILLGLLLVGGGIYLHNRRSTPVDFDVLTKTKNDDISVEKPKRKVKNDEFEEDENAA